MLGNISSVTTLTRAIAVIPALGICFAALACGQTSQAPAWEAIEAGQSDPLRPGAASGQEVKEIRVFGSARWPTISAESLTRMTNDYKTIILGRVVSSVPDPRPIDWGPAGSPLTEGPKAYKPSPPPGLSLPATEYAVEVLHVFSSPTLVAGNTIAVFQSGAIIDGVAHQFDRDPVIETGIDYLFFINLRNTGRYAGSPFGRFRVDAQGTLQPELGWGGMRPAQILTGLTVDEAETKIQLALAGIEPALPPTPTPVPVETPTPPPLLPPIHVGIDANADTFPANTATFLGTIEKCRHVSLGDVFTVDVVAASIPPFIEGGSGGITGADFVFSYNGTVRVIGVDTNMLVTANPGSWLYDGEYELPDMDGNLAFSFFEGGQAASESGAGVLARITLEVVLDAGINQLKLDGIRIIDTTGTAYPIAGNSDAFTTKIKYGTNACP